MKSLIAPLLGATLLALAPSAAQATIYTGNPDLEFRVDRAEGDLIDGSVLLNKLRITRCDGTWVDYTINKWIDPVAGFTKRDVIGGNLCLATWTLTSTMVVAHDDFVLQTDAATLVVDLDPFDDQFALPGVYVKSGEFWGGALQVHNTIE